MNRDVQPPLFVDQREEGHLLELLLALGEATLQGLYSQFVFNPKGLTISVYGSLRLGLRHSKCVAASDDMAISRYNSIRDLIFA